MIIMESNYVFKNNKKLRYGFTTGSCAAAASKAAAVMLLKSINIKSIELVTPNSTLLKLEVQDIERGLDYVSCAVRKDSGDDPDVTDKILVYSRVSLSESGDITIDGGIGVGRITKEGLDQPVGSAAINSVPRKMIYDEVKSVCLENAYKGGLNVMISIPQGVEIAKRTFNERLGIVNGISVLGTSGIVEPMSEEALIESIKTEMRMLKAQGRKNILITLGNYGENFSINELSIDIRSGIKCSNFIGETIDYAVELEFDGVLIVGHIGKLIKVAGGVMNTHSRNADCRMELLAAGALRAGISVKSALKLLDCVTADEALSVLINENIKDETMKIIMDKILYYLDKRAYGKLKTGVLVFSNKYGVLVKNEDYEFLVKDFKV